MANKDIYHPYVNESGKRVCGNASLLHHIKELGGIQNYHDEIGQEYINTFVKEFSNTIHNQLVQKARRSKFKVS